MKRILPFCLTLSCYLSLQAQKDCRQYEYQQHLVQQFPGLQIMFDKMASFEKGHANPFVIGGTLDTAARPAAALPVPEQIVIPVVVHIIWNTAAQNMSDERVLSQLDVLNKDFNGSNTDRGKIPAYFSAVAGNCGITFVLAKSDPQGRPTSGIVRRQTTTGIFGYDDKVKSTLTGGDDAWNAASYLNIWVCNLTGGISGYASAPGSPANRDGVVISTTAFGVTGAAGPFTLGRTAVHETGHWLNLRHIWGDASCGDDKVDDTPPQQAANRGCNTGKKYSCSNTANGDMYMNFMDFSDDACMLMFTKGQRQRMRALFETGGPRNSLLYSTALAGEGLKTDVRTPAEASFDFAVYPNPATTSIIVRCNGSGCLGKKLYLTNHLGQIIKMTLVTSNMQQLDISALNAGLYFIRVDGQATKKFVKN